MIPRGKAATGLREYRSAEKLVISVNSRCKSNQDDGLKSPETSQNQKITNESTSYETQMNF